MPDSVFLEDDPPKSGESRTVILVIFGLAGLGFVTLLVCAGGLFYLAAPAWKEVWKANQPVKMPLAEVESSQDKVIAWNRGFSGLGQGPAPALPAEMQPLFDALARATQAEDEAAFHNLIDVPRYFEQMKRSGQMPPITIADEQRMILEAAEWLAVPRAWERYVVASVNPVPGIDEAEVCLVSYDADGEATETRCWVKKSVAGWKLFDWETVQFGVRQSYEQAVYVKYYDDLRRVSHFQALGEVDEADELMSRGDYAGAAEKILSAETRRSIPELSDYLLVSLAYAWSRCRRWEDVLRVSRQVKIPEATPGALYAGALACQNLGMADQALEFAKRYEAAVGGGPIAWELQAEALAALDLEAEAIPCWRKTLELEPDDASALQSLAQALPDDEKHELTGYIRKTSEPVENAVKLAEYAVAFDDTNALSVMLGTLEEIKAPRDRIDFIRALSAQNDEQYEAAAGFFRLAWEQTEDEAHRRHCIYRFLDAMRLAGKMIEGYRAAPDARKAFRYLTDDYDEGELDLDDPAVRELVDAHREKEPQDPWLHYVTGSLLAAEEKYEEAAKEFNAGWAAADEDDRGRYREGLITSQHSAGHIEEAYRTIEPADQTFHRLADLCRWSEQVDELERLIALHRTAHADDPWLDHFAAVVQMKRKNLDEADRLLARGSMQDDDDYLRSSSRWLRQEIALERDKVIEAWRNLGADDETFQQLAQRLSTKENWSQLGPLIAAHRAAGHASAAALYWEAQLRWHREDYAGVISLLTPWPQRELQNLPVYQSDELKEKLVRCHIRLERVDEGLRLAQSMYDEKGFSRPLVLVNAHRRDPEQVRKALNLRGRNSYAFATIYDDEDVGDILCSTEFLAVREEHPRPFPTLSGDVCVVLLMKDGGLPSAELLRTAAVEALGESATVEEWPSDETPAGNLRNFLVRNGAESLLVTGGTDQFQRKPQPKFSSIHSETLRNAVQNHRGWLAITRLSLRQSLRSPNDVRSYRLASALAGESCCALLTDFPNVLVEFTPAVRDVLKTENPGEALEKLGQTFWMWRDDEPDRAEKERLEKIRRTLRQFKETFDRRPAGIEFRIAAFLDAGLAREKTWLTVTQVRRTRYGAYEFRTRLESTSRLAPDLVAGEPFFVNTYSIVDLDYPQQGAQQDPPRESAVP
jgi:tetratricopeptide (TPR) repeat protein